MNNKSYSRGLTEKAEPFTIGLVLTVLYVLSVCYEIFIAGASGTVIESNGLNSLGDFLAGMFAPLAFLWLVVTVFLQKQELALTRREMVETREVMIEQAAEAKAQKEFIEQQTAIMKRQADLAEQTYIKNRKLQMFDRRIEVYDQIKKYSTVPIYELHRKDSYLNFLHLLNKARYLFSGDVNIESWMNNISDLLYDLSAERPFEETRNEWNELMLPEHFDEVFRPHLDLGD